jgi:UDP-glucose 4-epimerase
MQSSKKTYIVTGGAGFIGSHLVDALIERGHEVRVIDNLSSGSVSNVNPKATLFKLNICDLEAMRPVFAGADGVFHMAAIVSVQYSLEHPEEARAVNLEGTRNVIEAAKANQVKRLVFSSSSAVYGEKDGAITETASTDPQSPYGAQKLEGEKLCFSREGDSALEAIALRYFNVYGPRQRGDSAYSGVIARFLKLKREGKPFSIYGDGSQTRDFISVHDIVSANIIAMDSKDVEGEPINIGSGKATSVKELAEVIGGEIEYLPARIEPKNSLSNISKAKELLIWNPTVPLKEGINELLM